MVWHHHELIGRILADVDNGPPGIVGNRPPTFILEQ
jgi:hypothetical protein